MHRPAAARTLLPAALVGVTIAIAACGGDDDAVGADPAQLAPPDVPVFVDVIVRPEGDIADRARAALDELTGSEDPGGFVVSQLDDLLDEQETGVTYEHDIEPWLGQRAGLFVSELAPDAEPDLTLIFAVTDQVAAQETIDKLNEVDNSPRTEEDYEGASYSLSSEDSAVGFVEDFLVIGSDASFRAAVDAANGDALAADPSYTELIDLAEPDRLLSAYVDSAGLIDELAASGVLSLDDVESVLDQLGVAGEGAALAWVALTADEVSLEVAGPGAGGPPPAGSALLEQLPADSWLAVAGADVGEAITAAAGLTSGAGFDVGSDDVAGAIESELGLNPAEDLAWVGDAAAFVSGTSLFGIGVGIVAETTDPAASAASLQRLGDSLERGGEVEVGPAERGTGFRVGIPGVPLGADVVQEGDQVIVAGGGASVQELLDPGPGGLDSSEGFTRAQDGLGTDFDVIAYLNLADLLAVIEQIPNVSDDPDFQTAQGVLEGLDYLVLGSRREGDVDLLRVVLGLQGGD